MRKIFAISGIPPAAARLKPVRGTDPFKSVEESIRKNSKTFLFATALLPRRKRIAIRALYAFCRATDDLVDVSLATHEQVEEWREMVRLSPKEQRHPLLQLWSITRQQYSVDSRYEEELITGVACDIQPVRYKTWEELKNYCYHVASTVGLLSIPIIGLRKGVHFDQAAPYAIQLGIALQLTNILRDVGEDARRGRVYLPDEDLERFDLTRSDILAGVQDDRFHALMKFEIDRARKLYQEALPGVAMLSPSGRLAVGAAALFYRAILDEIEANRYCVHQFRAHTTERKKLAMLPGILLTIWNMRSPQKVMPLQDW